MSGIEMFNSAMTMLGYATADGINGKEDMLKKALTVINLVYADLYYAFVGEEFKELKTISEDINLPKKLLHNVMPYGVAMYLAQSESDADNQSLYAMLYNEKRKGIKRVDKVIDGLPTTWG